MEEKMNYNEKANPNRGRKPFRTLFIAVVIGIFCILTVASPSQVKPEKPTVQIAVLLDTSNSMDGLIDQAKTQLWKIVNEMATAKKDGLRPKLEVALFEYGNDGLPALEGHIRLVVPLSEDLDKISDELFRLKTNGGSEYCGQVIQKAARVLQWSPNNTNLKMIFIAGNEEFTQGGIDYTSSCKEAIGKGIIINTIFCGNFQEGVSTKWKDGADLADGKYMNIDQNQKIVDVVAPQDKELLALGQQLNKTYVAYGKGGSQRKEMQVAQDSNAGAMNNQTAVERTYTKASANYSNVSWDIVDAKKDGKVKVEEMDESLLPEEMKKMTKEQRKAYIEKKEKERAEIQAKINKLKQERDKYVAAEQKKLAGENTLDAAIINAVKEEAKKKNYTFEKK